MVVRIGRLLQVPVVAALLVILTGCTGFIGRNPSGMDAVAPVEGASAPDLALSDLNGEDVMLSDLRGKVVLLNFWATWCGYCRSERATLQKAHEEYGDQGFAVLAVAIGEERRHVQDFAEQHSLTFPILLDLDGAVARSYGVGGIPATFFVDREGVIRTQHIGPLGEPLIAKYLQQLL